MKRSFDLIVSLIALLILSPLFIVFSILIVLGSKGGALYFQTRAGKNQKAFKLIKFRTMRKGSDKSGQLTLGNQDPRITRVGHFLRKYKLDELPQLINIFCGQMSFVGPRPEVPEYVKYYTPEQLKVLSVKPGLTDYASLKYINESEILGKAEDPEKVYLETVMPAKLKMNLQYIQDQSFILDLKILFRTISAILRSGKGENL